jgi:hypothetical protein
MRCRAAILPAAAPDDAHPTGLAMDPRAPALTALG